MNLIDLFFEIVDAVFSQASITEFVLFATVLLLTTLAAFVAKRSGIFNLALDGTVVISACSAYIFAQSAAHLLGGEPSGTSVLVGVVMGLVAGLAFTWVVGWLIIRAGGNDVIIGLLANFSARHFSILMVGVCAGMFQVAGSSTLPVLHLAFLDGVPFFGPLIGNSNLMAWLTVALPFAVFWMVNRTGLGMNLRAAEENPAALVNAGVEVSTVRMQGLLLSGVLASLAGIACAMGAAPSRSTATVPQSFGYLALVMVFAAGGRLGKSCGFALLFSFLGALPAMLQDVERIPLPLVRSIVYLAAIVLMMLHVFRHSHRLKLRLRKQVHTAKQRTAKPARPKKEKTTRKK